MSDLIASLRAHLLTDATIAAAVGTRVVQVGEDAPFITQRQTYISMQRTDGDPQRHLSGLAGLMRTRMQIDCVAGTASAAETVSNAAQALLDGFQGSLGTGDYRMNVREIVLDLRRDLSEEPDDGSERPIHRRILVFVIWHEG